jgi:hypothetical protein
MSKSQSNIFIKPNLVLCKKNILRKEVKSITTFKIIPYNTSHKNRTAAKFYRGVCRPSSSLLCVTRLINSAEISQYQRSCQLLLRNKTSYVFAFSNSWQCRFARDLFMYVRYFSDLIHFQYYYVLGMRHTSTALYFYGASKKSTQAQDHFWK